MEGKTLPIKVSFLQGPELGLFRPSCIGRRIIKCGAQVLCTVNNGGVLGEECNEQSHKKCLPSPDPAHLNGIHV